ncbi:MAG: hypothetical protein QW156_04825 [Candidatus Aenigmatarchaeota archaeon]
MVWSFGIGLPARGGTLTTGIRREDGIEEVTISKLDLEYSANTLTTMISSIENRPLNAKFVKLSLKGILNMNTWYWYLYPIFIKTDSGTGPYTHTMTVTDDSYKGCTFVFSNGYNKGQVYNLIPKRFQIILSPREVVRFTYEGVGIYSTTHGAPDSTPFVTHYAKPTLTVNGTAFQFLDFTITITHSNEAPTLTLDLNDDSNFMTGKLNFEAEGKLISQFDQTTYNSINTTIGSTNLTSTETSSNTFTLNLVNCIQKLEIQGKIGENYIYGYKGRNPTSINFTVTNNVST